MAQPESRVSYEEYLAFDDASQAKHEYVNGQVLAMAGGSRRHSALASRVSAALENGRRGGCIAFQADMRIRILATGRAAYPDASVVCGPLEGDPADKKDHTITNPTLIVEVLSPTTEADDRGEKWAHYQRIPSLQEYILISQDRMSVERFRRDGEKWGYMTITEGVVELASGGVLDIAKLYEGLPDETD